MVNMRIGVLGVCKSSLIERIVHGTFSLQYFPTTSVEITKIRLGGLPVALIESNHPIDCDLVLLLCYDPVNVLYEWRLYHQMTPAVVVVVGENPSCKPMYPEMHYISNMTATGIPQLICSLYIKSSEFYQ